MKSRWRKILMVALIGLVIVGLIHIGHAIFIDTKIKYHFIEYQSETLPKKLDGYTLVFISDIHDCSEQQLVEIVTYLNLLDVDLVLLGGDYTMPDRLDQTLQLLSTIKTNDGIYGVDGNHDQYRILFETMKKYDIIPLDNEGVYLHDNFYIAGIQDLWNRNPDIEKATASTKEEDFIILVSHNPDVVMKQNTSNIDLTLSGHTHGGEISFFGIFEPVFLAKKITSYGQRFSGGWSTTMDGKDIYVSLGLGKQFLRIFAQPEIVIITFKIK